MRCRRYFPGGPVHPRSGRYHYRDAAHHRSHRPSLELPAVLDTVVGVRLQLGRLHYALLVQVDEREIGVGADVDVPLARLEVEDVCRPARALRRRAEASRVFRMARRRRGEPLTVPDMLLMFLAGEPALSLRAFLLDQVRQRRNTPDPEVVGRDLEGATDAARLEFLDRCWVARRSNWLLRRPANSLQLQR
jgi:hypothetical protein